MVGSISISLWPFSAMLNIKSTKEQLLLPVLHNYVPCYFSTAFDMRQFLLAEIVFIANINHKYMSRVMRKPDFCLCENKGADQRCSDCTVDQHLCFRYSDSTILLLLKSEI